MNAKEKIDTPKIRNIGFIAHIDAGKTTVTERVLFFTGETYKIGDIDEGTTVMDFMSLERERGITIGSAATNATWQGHQVNIIDTPGHVDFTAEVERSLRVLDGGVVVLESVSGVQPQSETVWRQADKYRVPRLVFVNKMDRAGANFIKSVQTLHTKLGANAVPIQIPMGAEKEFEGMIDLVAMKAYIYNSQDAIAHSVVDIPEKYILEAQEARENLIETLADLDDSIMENFLEGKDIAQKDMEIAIRNAVINMKIFPVLCGSALRHRGVHPLLDAVVDYLPAPTDLPAVEGHSLSGNNVNLKPNITEPFSALVFKVSVDQHVGKLVYVRIYSGNIKAGTAVYNSTTRNKERVGRIVKMHADDREDVKQASAGEIVALIGPKQVRTGDTLCEQNNQVILESISFPDPVISVAVEPRSRSEQERMSEALVRLSDEDPTLRLSVDHESGQTVLSGMGELHLDVVVERIKREFKVAMNVGAPKVAYRETITRKSEAKGKFIRQTGGHGQYGDCTLRIEPLERNSGLQFESAITGSTLPTEWYGPIEQGFRESAQSGTISGYPVVDVKAVLINGSHHEVDSSEVAFKIAASLAFKSAMNKAKPVILEPIMKMEILTPSDFLGDVLGDLNSRRAEILSIDEGQSNASTINAYIPLSETFQYATHLRSMTTGRAVFAMQMDHYDKVPPNIVESITSVANEKVGSA